MECGEGAKRTLGRRREKTNEGVGLEDRMAQSQGLGGVFTELALENHRITS